MAAPLGSEEPRETPLEACRRKRRFATEREADDAVYLARMEGRTEEGKTLGYYRCDWCGGWHLTSRQPGGRLPPPPRKQPRGRGRRHRGGRR